MRHCMCVEVAMSEPLHVWRLEVTFRSLVLAFTVKPGDQMQVSRFAYQVTI